MIPARMASTRLLGKPLCKICGIPLIEHVYKRAAMSEILNELYVATCDEEIIKVVEGFGGQGIMTSSTHQRCTDRIAEACQNISTDADIVVNIQGDEPLLYPEMIDMAVGPLIENLDIVCSNLIAPINSMEEFEDLNEIKVVVDREGFALYFSREPIPTCKKGAKKLPMFKQVCIIPFRKDFLMTFTQLSPTPLEIAESIDMLRVLEHGYRIRVVESRYETYSVDTVEDLKKVEKKMKNDPLFHQILKGLNERIEHSTKRTI